MHRILSVFAILIVAVDSSIAAQVAVAAPPERRTHTIQCLVRTERWDGWGDGVVAPDAPVPPRPPEKLERFETPAGAIPTFSGKVIGVPPGKAAQVTVVANVGTQWIQPNNYKSVKVAADGRFTLTADHKPDVEKSLAVNIDGRLARFLRADFAANESAKNIEFHLGQPRTVVLSMDDPQGNAVRNFRVEVFNAYTMHDDAGAALRIQRLAAAASTGNGVIVFEAPLEPIAVLLSSNGLAPYYEIIDPRQADQFHFKMLPASRIRGVVTRNGQPVAGQQIYLVNRAAPLSATLRRTDPQGRFDIAGRVPGQQDIRIGEFQTSVKLEPGETADLNLEVAPADAGAATSPATDQ